MLARILSGTTIGLDGVLIEVEVDVAGRGFPSFTIVGLPGKAVDEAKERVRTAIVNASFDMPDSRLTVNLAPADIPKAGSSFDLPIAIGVLTASGAIKKDLLKDSLFIGELSLEGKIRRVPGIISLALLAKKLRIERMFLPEENSQEASLIKGVEIYPASCLSDLVLHLNGQISIKSHPHVSLHSLSIEKEYEFDFSDVKGQEQAKRALEIAASGFHNILLTGPPGTGKTMLSRAFPSILPLMDVDEMVEVSKIYSISGLLTKSFFVSQRPFRSPHHTTSRIGLVGGGARFTPGEISLAHRGVLFLDELAEFPRSVLEALRQPMEDGYVTIARASGSITFPSRFLLLSASNPCPCGYLGHPKKSCRCSPGAIFQYKKRLSGPLLDRIDLHVDVPLVDDEKLNLTREAESSSTIRKRVFVARERQKKRLRNVFIKTNGEMTTRQIKQYCRLVSEALDLLKQAVAKLALSPRSYFKVIKIAQTITDLKGIEKIEASSIAEALQYRAKEE